MTAAWLRAAHHNFSAPWQAVLGAALVGTVAALPAPAAGRQGRPCRRLLRCESASAGGSLTVEQTRESAKAQQWVELNCTKSSSILVNTDTQAWIESPAAGVRRKLIERLGGEVARATTIVRFEPGSAFPSHTHGGGEEFLVLEGTWFDEWAEQPRYTYVRNYIGSQHAPRIGVDGCTILVKLRQMAREHPEPEHTQWNVSPGASSWTPCPEIPGRWVLPVYESPYERVHFERWDPHTPGLVEVPAGGQEVFVVEGGFVDELGDHRVWSWARSADGTGSRLRVAGPQGCFLYVKSAHLLSPEVGVSE